MKPNRIAALGATLALAAFVAGCGDNATEPSAGGTSDQSQIAGLLLAAPSLIDDGGLYRTADQTTLAPALPRSASPRLSSPTPSSPRPAGAPAAPIEPHEFWRDITTAFRTFEFDFADSDSTGQPTTAIATVHWRLAGTFNIVTQATDTDPSRLVHKPLVDHWQRRVLLRRIPMEGGDPARPIWRIAAVSGVEVASPEPTTQISSLHVQSATLDTTITDPLAFFYLRRILRFGPDEEVTLTVTTARNDDVVLLYHHESRTRMTNNGDDTYTGVMPAGSLEGWHHFGVNALSHGTLFDDEAPYDSRAWILPYAVPPTPEVDYLP